MTDLSSKPQTAPLATDPSTRRRPTGPNPEVIPPHPTHPGQEAGATAYPSPEQEPLATARDTRRRHPRRHELFPGREQSPAEIGATAYPAPAGPARDGEAFHRNRGLSSFPVASQRVLARPGRASGTPPSEMEPGATTYPGYDPDAVIFEGTLGSSWRAERWRP